MQNGISHDLHVAKVNAFDLESTYDNVKRSASESLFNGKGVIKEIKNGLLILNEQGLPAIVVRKRCAEGNLR